MPIFRGHDLPRTRFAAGNDAPSHKSNINFYATRSRDPLTGCLHGTIVGPTGRSDWSVRLVCPTIVSCKRFVRPVGQTVGRTKHVWFRPTADPTVEACGHYIRPTGRTDRPVGRPITLQRRRYLLLTS